MIRIPIIIVSAALFGGAAITCDAQTASINLGKGQLVSFVASTTKPGRDSAREQYFQQLQPVASLHGFRLEGSFRIRDAKAGDFKPSPPVMNLFSWPNAEARRQFSKDPRSTRLISRRKSIWRELRIATAEVDQDLRLRFHPDKLYRVVFVWTNRDHPEALQRYRSAMSNTTQKLGARYLIELAGEDFESLTEKRRPPDRMWIVEWPSRKAHQDYISSDAFHENSHHFHRGVEIFEAFDTAFVFDG